LTARFVHEAVGFAFVQEAFVHEAVGFAFVQEAFVHEAVGFAFVHEAFVHEAFVHEAAEAPRGAASASTAAASTASEVFLRGVVVTVRSGSALRRLARTPRSGERRPRRRDFRAQMGDEPATV
jgi:hypothetical protein